MSGIRRAIVWASAGQNLILAINFVTLLVMVRLLTPAEYGVASLGWAILGIAEAVREFGGGAFLIREHELTPEKIRSCTTVNFLITIVVAAAIILSAELLAHFFEMPALAPYLGVTVISYILGSFMYPQQALLSRELAFRPIAIINIVAAVTGAAVSILLALMGCSTLSLAWASLASAMAATLLLVAFRADLSIYRPSLSQWHSVIGFGKYSGATAVLGRTAEAVPLLIFGKLLGADALAIGHRAVLLCLLPERIMLAAVATVALPAFSQQARNGRDLKAAYLAALSHVTGVHWPIMVSLAILAEPVVRIVLGEQWLQVVPLVRILTPALMLAGPIALQYAMLVAVDGIHLLPRLLLLQTLVMTAAISITASFGLRAAALSMFVVMPINVALSLMTVRSKIAFRWTELIAAVARSAVVTATTAAGPIALALSTSSNMPLMVAILAVALGAGGWILGLYATSHPLWPEIGRLAGAVVRAWRRSRLPGTS